MNNLKFVDTSAEYPERKTKIIEIYSSRNGSLLGIVQWYAPWRRYVFEPYVNIFDSGCLHEIITNIDLLMEERVKK